MSRNKLILSTTGILVGMFFFIWGMMFATKRLPVKIIAIIFYVLEIMVVVPIFNREFFKLNKAEMGLDKIFNFVPFINYTVPMRPIMARVVWVVEFLFLVLLVIPFFPSVIQLFGDSVLLQAQDYLPLVDFLAFFGLNIVIGVGLIPVVKDVNTLYQNSFTVYSTRKGVAQVMTKVLEYLPFLEYLFLFFPFIRMASLLNVIDRETTLLKCKKFFD